MNHTTPTDLRHAILKAPESIQAIASEWGINPIAYVRPGLYTNPSDRSWNEHKAERNLAEIKLICDGADIIITDMEKEPRRRVLHPDDYEPEEVNWAINDNFVPMWKWFRARWPKAKLSEFGLSRGRFDGEFELADELIIKHLDALDVSAYGKPDRTSWPHLIKGRIQHARELADEHDKLVVTWIWDRYKKYHQQDEATEFRPLPTDIREQMLNMAIAAGIDVTVFWSNCYHILDAGKPERYLTESVNHTAEEALVLVDAQAVRLLAEMRLQEPANET